MENEAVWDILTILYVYITVIENEFIISLFKICYYHLDHLI